MRSIEAHEGFAGYRRRVISTLMLLVAVVLAVIAIAFASSSSGAAAYADSGDAASSDQPATGDATAGQNLTAGDASVPTTTLVGEGLCGDNLKWELDDKGALKITGTGDMATWNSKAKVPWYEHRAAILSITLQEGVTSIGRYAFADCPALESISIPASVASIGPYAFDSCAVLKTVTVQNNSQLNSMDKHAFNKCDVLATVNSTSKFAYLYFSELSSAIEQPLPVYERKNEQGVVQEKLKYAYGVGGEGVWIVGADGMASWRVIPATIGGKTVVGIAERAFYRDTALRGVTFENNSQIKTIEPYAFYGCTSLADEFIVPPTVTAIGARAFEKCKLLSAISFVDSKNPGKESALASIGERAFSECTALENVLVPKAVAEIGSYAFSGVDEIRFPYGSLLETVENRMFAGCKHVYLGDGTKTIGANGFNNSLVNVYLPKTVSLIGKNGFSGCNKLESVNSGSIDALVEQIPDAVTEIGDSAFSGCTSLTSIGITGTSKLTSIGASAFSGCSKLALISVPVTTLTSIGASAFSGCSSLASAVFPDTVSTIGASAFSGCRQLTAFRIPAAVSAINAQTFYNCSSLASVTFPENSPVASIGASAFEGCKALTGISLPATIRAIGNKAFKSCTAFTALALVDDETLAKLGMSNASVSIGASAFEGCTALNSLILPASVTLIDEMAFFNCSKLEKVDIRGEAVRLYENCFKGIAYPSEIFVASYEMFAQMTENDNFVDNSQTAVIVEGGNMYYIGKADVTVDPTSYAGDATQIHVTVKYGDELLTEGVDYELIREDAVKAGKWNVIVKGIKKASDNVRSYVGFKREDVDIQRGSVTVPTAAETHVYDGHEYVGVVGIDAEKCSLKSGVVKATKAGEYTAEIMLADKNNYQWSDGTTDNKIVTWTIEHRTVTITPDNLIMTYGDRQPALTANVSGALEGDESTIRYRLSRESGNNVGDYAITATGNEIQGNYKVAFATAALTIAKCDLSSATIAMRQTSYPYTGAEIKPYATVRLNDRTLRSGTDYEVKYANNVDMGTATMLVTGIGNYTGSVSAHYKITAEGSTAGLAVGKSARVGRVTYKAISTTGVVFSKVSGTKKKVKVPATVTIFGRHYSVIGIGAKAFKNAKAKTVVVESTQLTKKSVRKCFKGSKVKVVKVPKDQKVAYKKIFTKKNVGKKVKVK